MKRLIVLALVCSFVLSAAVASAVDVKTSGNVLTNFVWRSNWDFNDDASDRTSFEVFQRSDLYFTMTADENLKAVIGLRSEREEWGDGDAAVGTPGNGAWTFGVRDLYIDFTWPGTAVNAQVGVKSVTLPNEIGGSFLQDERGGAVLISTNFTDNVGIMAGWTRLDNTSASYDGTNANGNGESEIDAWILSLPLTFEGLSVTPFGAYVPMGDNAIAIDSMRALNATTSGVDQYDDAYWLGVSMSMDMFDPFVLKADVNYGKVSGDDDMNDRSGWLAAAALEYKGFDFMTPEVYFVYTSGEDGNSTEDGGDSERLPTLAQDWAVGSFFFGGESVTAASLDNGTAQNGFWLIGLDLKDIQSFAEGLSHNLHIFYAQGTNDENSRSTATGELNNGLTYGRTLTEDDSLVEISSTTAYEIYDALTLYVDLGYINLDADTDAWGAGNDGGDAWKFATGMVFKF